MIEMTIMGAVLVWIGFRQEKVLRFRAFSSMLIIGLIAMAVSVLIAAARFHQC